MNPGLLSFPRAYYNREIGHSPQGIIEPHRIGETVTLEHTYAKFTSGGNGREQVKAVRIF